MKPLQVVKEQSLISKAKPMRETEERRTDHHHRRANKAKRSRTRSAKWRRARSAERRRPSGTKTVTKEKAPPGEAEGMETEFPRKAERMEGKSRAVKVVMRAEELFMSEMLLMAEGHKRPKVVVRPKELFMAKVLLMAESPKMTHSRMAKVTQSALETACMAPHAKSSYAMCPDLCGEAHRDRKDAQCCGSLFHSFRPPEEASNPPKSQKRKESGEDL